MSPLYLPSSLVAAAILFLIVTCCMAALMLLAVMRHVRDEIKMTMHSEIDGLAKHMVAQLAAKTHGGEKREGIVMVGCSNFTLIVDSVVSGRQVGTPQPDSGAADAAA